MKGEKIKYNREENEYSHIVKDGRLKKDRKL
jgi:hypothetical protein